MRAIKERLFLSLGQQLKYEIPFTSFVSRSYYSKQDNNQIIDFNYKSRGYQLVLNGSIILKTPKEDKEVNSYDDLVQGLLQSV